MQAGAPVGGTGSASLGPEIRTAWAARGADNTVAATVAAHVGDNSAGVAQSGAVTGTYQATAATQGPALGQGALGVDNTPKATGHGSVSTLSGQWSSPDGGFRATVTGSADFTSMQIPKIQGGIVVTTPMGVFKTPPIG
ncbi:hypothetical protein [Gordonia alkanivorans]|uniref:hypothetical protein n=1 Tax=Gordonia alkanivorans TaxID=84096 RepID=UPI0005A9D214|nr:hypothetical protein [Gordonia alkanivorans]